MIPENKELLVDFMTWLNDHDELRFYRAIDIPYENIADIFLEAKSNE